MSYHESPRARITREQLIAAKVQMVRDAVYGLANFEGSQGVQEGLLRDGNLAIGGLGLMRVTAGEHETFSGDHAGWERRIDHSGIGVLRELTADHLIYERDGRVWRTPVGKVNAIRREVSTDPALRDDNGNH